MNSQHRRYERYGIIYMWKVLEEKSPNCNVETESSESNGREVKVPTIQSKTGQLRDSSFQVHCARLFNSLPQALRNESNCSEDDFKENLDVFFSTIPDQPKSGDFIPSTCDYITATPLLTMPGC